MMKFLLFRLGIMLLSFSIGVSAFQVLTNYYRKEWIPPVVLSDMSYECSSTSESFLPVKNPVVISIPCDNEFYVDKDRVSLYGIPDRVRNQFRTQMPSERVIFIKASRDIKFETVSSVVEKIKGAGVNRIELVLDKKRFSRQ